MAERFNAAVLKTVVLHGTGGSNPSLSATKEPNQYGWVFFFQAMKVDFHMIEKELSCEATYTGLLHCIIPQRDQQS